MTRPDYLNFSRIGGKEALVRRAEKALAKLEAILDAPYPAKKNLMETDFKAAVATGNIIKTFVQAESANTMAMAVLSERMGAKGGADFIEANVPGLKEPKQLNK